MPPTCRSSRPRAASRRRWKRSPPPSRPRPAGPSRSPSARPATSPARSARARHSSFSSPPTRAFRWRSPRRASTRDRGAVYATGRLAIVVPRGSTLAADGTLGDLRAALAEGRIARFAIANPVHAPYGRAAKQALENAGIWDAVEPKLVYGENIAQAAQFAVSGSAQGGIVAWSLASTPKLAAISDAAPIPERLHAPLHHRMVLLTGAGQTAEAFYDWLLGPEARAILERNGFSPPADPS